MVRVGVRVRVKVLVRVRVDFRVRVGIGVRIRINLTLTLTLTKTLKLNPNLLSYWECCRNMVRKKIFAGGTMGDRRFIRINNARASRHSLYLLMFFAYKKARPN